MIRIAFEYPALGAGWTGGLNYLRNLFKALEGAPDLDLHPLVLAGRRTEVGPEVGSVEVVRTPLLDEGDPRRLLRLLWRRASATDPSLDWLLQRQGAAVLSHSGYLGRGARVRSISWFADFQHRHLPELFSAVERRLRDDAISAFCRFSDRVIVSSESARSDLLRWFPLGSDKVRVLPFVDCSAAAGPTQPIAPLEARHGFSGPFLLLPNQFWEHKNHRLVLQALAALRAQGRSVLVIATGHPRDYRNPGYFDELMRLRAQLGLEQSFRVLGLVPYSDLGTLMHHAIALLNPSRFEGWSTVVEGALVVEGDDADLPRVSRSARRGPQGPDLWSGCPRCLPGSTPSTSRPRAAGSARPAWLARATSARPARLYPPPERRSRARAPRPAGRRRRCRPPGARAPPPGC